MLLRIAIFNVVFKTGYLGFQSRFLNMHLTLFYVAVYQCIFSGLIYRFCHEKTMCFMHFILIGILYNLTSQNAGNRSSGTLNFKTFPGVHVCPQIPLRCLPSPALDNPPPPNFLPWCCYWSWWPPKNIRGCAGVRQRRSSWMLAGPLQTPPVWFFISHQLIAWQFNILITRINCWLSNT
jgi:hypothetical protein